MKCTQVKTFLYENGVRVEFQPIKNVPGFTHRVWLLELKDGRLVTIGKDWFTPVNGHRIGKRTADFYLTEHTQGGK